MMVRGKSVAIPSGPSMKVPPKRKGNEVFMVRCVARPAPSMKVPPKRKGNLIVSFLPLSFSCPQ